MQAGNNLKKGLKNAVGMINYVISRFVKKKHRNYKPVNFSFVSLLNSSDYLADCDFRRYHNVIYRNIRLSM
ncbi:hypothetical protein HMPREF2600_11675 [Neisseria sp. HMSC077D05]|nr:hypothetical protein HMPREF2600_11675 [Neisseria sp. HMSC077D05]